VTDNLVGPTLDGIYAVLHMQATDSLGETGDVIVRLTGPEAHQLGLALLTAAQRLGYQHEPKETR
jgi:hypothetical protein